MAKHTSSRLPQSSSAEPEVVRICRTLESLVVAFILAFVFITFVIQAFVIPTGSMAATLYGAHFTFTCPDCGYEYVGGYNEGLQNQPHRIVCPNCLAEIMNPPRHRVERGDQILVFKFPFDIGGRVLGARRWDVTVFRNPGGVDIDYIKRVIGLPEEVIEIIDGDIYVAPASALSAELLGALDEPPWQRRSLEPALQAQLDAQLRLVPKSRAAQQSLWFDVYLQDYPITRRREASATPGFYPVGDERGGWTDVDGQLRFDGVGRELGEMAFSGRPIVDVYAYNTHMGPPPEPVSDLRFSAVLTPDVSSGYVQMMLMRHDERFRVRLEMDGRVELVHLRASGDGPAMEVHRVGEQVEALAAGVPVTVAMSNVDHVVRFELDGRSVVTLPWSIGVAEARALASRADPPQVRVGACDTTLTLGHVRLQRDVHYRSQPIQEPRDMQTGHVNHYMLNKPGWATAGWPKYLRRGEYFMLGDNSPASKDSRLWWHASETMDLTRSLRRELGAQQQQLRNGQPLMAGQVATTRMLLGEVGRTLGRAPWYRREALSAAYEAVAEAVEQRYLSAAQVNAAEGASIVGGLGEPLELLDWEFYHAGTVPADHLIGRAACVIWPAGLAPPKVNLGFIPNVGRVRLIR